LSVEDGDNWEEISEAFYIYGGIGGNWVNRFFSSEVPANKMTGYASGNKRYWSFTPPGMEEGADHKDDPNYDWYGSIYPGQFRFKKGGANEFVLFDGTNIVKGTSNDEAKSFITSAGGNITIKLFFDGTNYNKVTLEAEGKSLEFVNGDISVNGTSVSVARTFAGASLTKKEGTFYVFEGIAPLEEDQTITATGFDLSVPKADPDVFTGQGNAQWQMKGLSGEWLVTVDPFANTVQVVNQEGYSSAIYMDGWGWAKFDSDNSKEWTDDYILTLQRVGNSSVYEATFHHFGWGADVKFFTEPRSVSDHGKRMLNAKHFTLQEGQETGGGVKILPNVEGRMKVSVDLKDGFDFDEETMDGDFYSLTLKGAKFTVTFTEI
jgi:hypothetical protein